MMSCIRKVQNEALGATERMCSAEAAVVYSGERKELQSRALVQEQGRGCWGMGGEGHILGDRFKSSWGTQELNPCNYVRAWQRTGERV